MIQKAHGSPIIVPSLLHCRAHGSPIIVPSLLRCRLPAVQGLGRCPALHLRALIRRFPLRLIHIIGLTFSLRDGVPLVSYLFIDLSTNTFLA